MINDSVYVRDKLSSSGETRIRTWAASQAPNRQQLNACSQTDWAIEDQVKIFKSIARHIMSNHSVHIYIYIFMKKLIYHNVLQMLDIIRASYTLLLCTFPQFHKSRQNDNAHGCYLGQSQHWRHAVRPFRWAVTECHYGHLNKRWMQYL